MTWLEIATATLASWVFQFIMMVPLILLLSWIPRRRSPFPPLPPWRPPWWDVVETWTCPKCDTPRRELSSARHIALFDQAEPDQRPCPSCGYARDVQRLCTCKQCGVDHPIGRVFPAATPDPSGPLMPVSPVSRCPSCGHREPHPPSHGSF